jgi:hypothetical protein
MAQSFYANSATRLHPEEWGTGVSAGVAAALMVKNGWETTEQIYKNIDMLQDALREAGQPLEWDL